MAQQTHSELGVNVILLGAALAHRIYVHERLTLTGGPKRPDGTRRRILVRRRGSFGLPTAAGHRDED